MVGPWGEKKLAKEWRMNESEREREREKGEMERRMRKPFQLKNRKNIKQSIFVLLLKKVNLNRMNEK